MELDLKKVGYALLGIALLIAVNNYLIQPSYKVIKTAQTAVESVGTQSIVNP